MTLNGELVSILMPVRNEEAAIAGAVASALAQTYDPIEVIVIDGRSSDRTREVVTEIAARDPRVRLLDNPKKAISPALNVGLAQARGTYIARMDGHATVNPEYVELGVRHLIDDPGVAAVGGRKVGVAESRTGKAISLALSSPFGVGDSINHYGTEVQETDHSSFGVYRTEVARSVNGWDEELVANEDVDFDFRILGRGHRMLYNPDMIINWHVRETVRDLGRQYRRYGRGKGAMVAKNGLGAIRARHLAAPALLGALAVAAGLAVAGFPKLALGLVAPYAAAVSAAGAFTYMSGRKAQAEAAPWAVPASFVAMHTSWGVGFFEGLAGRRPSAASRR